MSLLPLLTLFIHVLSELAFAGPEATPTALEAESEPEERVQPVPPLEFPEKGELDNLDLLHDYAEVAKVDESDADYAAKAKAWLTFAKKWSASKAYARHANRRAMLWLEASRTTEKWDEEFTQLLQLLDEDTLPEDKRRQLADKFLLEAPVWWQQERGAQQEIRARLGGADEEATSPTAESESSSATPGLSDVGQNVPDVIDFCGIKPKETSTHFVRQRVLTLPLSSTEIVEKGEIDIDGTTKVYHLKAADGAEIFEEMFRSYFPLKRFDTVLGESSAPDEWFDAKSLSLPDIEAIMQGDFDRYAASCADYIVIGKVGSLSGNWVEHEMTDPKTGEKIMVPMLNAKVKGEVSIFQRKGDSFERISQFQANSGGLLGVAAGFSGNLAQADIDPTGTVERIDEIGAANELSYVSLRPGPDCAVPAARDGVAALNCPGDLASLPELPGPPGMGESTKATCTDFEQIRTYRGAAICSIRKAGELFAVSAQKEARGTEGWRLFAPLDPPSKDGLPSIALGENEGVTLGMGFHAVMESGDGKKRVAYAKVKKVGTLREDGPQAPSELSWRLGEAPAGVRMEEYPQIGFTLALGPVLLGPVLSNSNIATSADAEAYAPRTFVGPELEVGYDLTRYTFNEFWLRFRLNYAIAPVTDYRFSTVNLQVGPEVRLAIFKRGYWFSNLVGNVSIAQLKAYVDRPGATSFGSKESGSDAVGGIELRTGLDLMINADFYLRLSLGWLQNFGRLEYEKDEEILFDRRDRLSGMTFALTLAYTL